MEGDPESRLLRLIARVKRTFPQPITLSNREVCNLAEVLEKLGLEAIRGRGKYNMKQMGDLIEGILKEPSNEDLIRQVVRLELELQGQGQEESGKEGIDPPYVDFLPS